MPRKRIKVRGFFVDSTLNYVMYNKFEPILESKPFVDNDNEFDIKVGANGKLYMSREEFEQHNIMRDFYKLVRIFMPTESELDASLRFLRNRKEAYRLRHKSHIKQKTLQEQGQLVNCA